MRSVSLAALSFVAMNCLLGCSLVEGPTAFRDSSDAWLYLHRKTTTIWTPAYELSVTAYNETMSGSTLSETVATRILDLQRQHHTRPPEPNLGSLDNPLLPTGSLLGPKATRIPVSTTNNKDDDWPKLCQAAGLNEASRVVIGGILSQPPGVPLALFLAKQCRVRVVLGVDSLFPNHKDTRLEQMQDYRLLMRYIEDVDLVMPPSGMDLADHEVVVQRLVDFRPTHIISIMTHPRDLQSIMADRDARYYEIKSGLVSVHTMLAALRTLSASEHPQPSFLHVTSSDAKDAAWNRLPSILLRSSVDVSVIHLQLPNLYGPMVAPWKDVRDMAPSRRMYVDDAIASILLALDRNATINNSTIISQASYTLVETYSSAMAAATGNLGALDAVYQNETQAWIDDMVRPQLGKSMNPGKYLDTYGVDRTRFPCASTCKSLQCTPTMLDPILHVTRKVTEGCRAVLYMVNYSSSLQDLPKQERANGASSTGELIGNICRIAFVSGNSKLVANVRTQQRRQQSGRALAARETDKDPLDRVNGMRIGRWNVVWVDRNETSLPDIDAALLRMDPSAFFARTVDRALYTESINLIQASDQRLEHLFRKIWLGSTPAKRVKQYDEKNHVWRWLTTDRQRPRRAILLTREPEETMDYQRFIARAGSTVHSRHKHFYKQASEIVLSREGRTEMESKDGQSDSFPYQWISRSFVLHELTMRFSQNFRCDWMQEYLFWGGGSRDSALLSFAYTLGKGIVEGSYSPRKGFEHDSSWLAMLSKEDKIRLENRRSEEVFARILPRDGPSDYR